MSWRSCVPRGTQCGLSAEAKRSAIEPVKCLARLQRSRQETARPENRRPPHEICKHQ
eukprot:NODE_7046_length_465_cov_82.102439.p5 GENE.NODE_7046_length_465_cov_82.102439~~NODE_7046_length_465_cov_82.102439.p5  ORF type:complete len:57 (-),score=3.18 NODE_7046_length_465_cov_82.102439:80-250(-)